MYRELTLCSLIVTATAFSIYETSTASSHLSSRGWVCGDETYPSSWICDGHNQCDDDSDEGKEPHQGCNLFPDSGCASFGGRRHYKCRRSGECFPDQRDADVCDAGFVTQLPSRDCSHEDSGEAGWRCDDGRCVTSDHVCDGVLHCDDGSDEGLEEHQVDTAFSQLNAHFRLILCVGIGRDATSSLGRWGTAPPGSEASTDPAVSLQEWRTGTPSALWSTSQPPETRRSVGGVLIILLASGDAMMVGASTALWSGTASRTAETAQMR